MPKLYVLRHAKSDWSDPDLIDFQRPLNSRGRKDTLLIVHALQSMDIPLKQVISSPALRALTTAQSIVEGLKPKPPILQADERLYHADPTTLNTVLVEHGTTESVLVVGHNPGLEEWIEWLCGAIIKLPPAGLAALDLGINKWSKLDNRKGELQWFINPKLLKKMTR